MSSLKSPKKEIIKKEDKLDEKTLNKLYYIRLFFGMIAGSISGLIPSFFSPFSIIILILFLFISTSFGKIYILKDKKEPPLRHGIGIYILSWLTFYIIIGTIMYYLFYQYIIFILQY